MASIYGKIMMDYPKVDVIIPVFNRERFITQTLESVLGQTYRNLEIVVVDDGSTDKSSEKIQPYLRHRNVKYLYQNNQGPALARNVGIRASCGDLIAFLDSDDIWLPNKLEKQIQFLARNPAIPLVHTGRMDIDAFGNRKQPSRSMDAQGYCFRDLFIANRIILSTVVVTRSCLNVTGAFNKEFRGCEDYDLWLRIARNHPIGYIDEVLALYRFHDSNLSRDSFEMTRQEVTFIESLLERFPECHMLLGRDLIASRLGDLVYQLACWYMWNARRHDVAKVYFSQSKKLRPFHFPSHKWFWWCSLTVQQRRICSWYLSKSRQLLGNRSKSHARE